MGSLMRVLVEKLRRVKRELRCWSKEVFDNIFDAVKVAEEAVRLQELVVETDPSEGSLVDLQVKQESLRLALNREAAFWRQKNRIRWLKKGDANSRFFHSAMKQQRLWLFIHCIKDGG